MRKRNLDETLEPVSGIASAMGLITSAFLSAASACLPDSGETAIDSAGDLLC